MAPGVPRGYADVEVLYESAWKLAKSFDLAANLGNVELLIDQPRDAAEHLAYALKNLPLGANAEKKEFIRKRLDEAKTRVGTVTVKVNVAGADVVVDGTSVGRSPLVGEVFVDPGKHTFEAREPEHDGPPQSREVAAGATEEVAIELTRRAGAIEAPSTPRDRSTFDQARPFLAIGFGVVAVAGFAVGIIETVVANGKSQDADDLLAEVSAAKSNCPTAPQCTELEARLSEQSSAENLAKAGYVVGGAGVIGLAAVLLWPKSRQAQPQRGAVSVIPLSPRGGGGLALRGAF